ncbi:MAG TPA: Flp family type IVb pilin [Clostridia bacterium]|jgi:pilus assembly protein Flp/PilA|nr:Flp family type IVb pilin [Clostridia bacterium]
MLNFVTSLIATMNGKLNNEEGQGMVEYILIIALIALVVILVFPAVSTAISDAFQSIADSL